MDSVLNNVNVQKSIEELANELESSFDQEEEKRFAEELINEHMDPPIDPNDIPDTKEENINAEMVTYNENELTVNSKFSGDSTKYQNVLNNNFNQQSNQPSIPIQSETTPKKSQQEENIDFLRNINVDLNNIEIIDGDPLFDIDNFNFFLNQKSKTQIVAIQSSYIAYVEGLDFNEANALNNSTLDNYSQELLLAQTIFSKINTTNIGKISFDKWCEITSYYDLESIVYGIYLETFPGDTHFTVKCGSCKNKIQAVINNDRLIVSKNEATTAKMKEILNNKTNGQSLLSSALIHKTKRCFLEDSKIIIDLKLPTVKKRLNLLSAVNETNKNLYGSIFTLMAFFDCVYMLDVRNSVNAHKPKYYKIDDNDRIAQIIGKLSYRDSQTLSKEINELIDRFTVEYKIRSFKCPHCGININDIPVEMQYLLFFQIQS